MSERGKCRARSKGTGDERQRRTSHAGVGEELERVADQIPDARKDPTGKCGEVGRVGQSTERGVTLPLTWRDCAVDA